MKFLDFCTFFSLFSAIFKIANKFIEGWPQLTLVSNLREGTNQSYVWRHSLLAFQIEQKKKAEKKYFLSEKKQNYKMEKYLKYE